MRVRGILPNNFKKEVEFCISHLGAVKMEKVAQSFHIKSYCFNRNSRKIPRISMKRKPAMKGKGKQTFRNIIIKISKLTPCLLSQTKLKGH